MSEGLDYFRHGRGSRPLESRQNKDPQPRSSYLRHFQEKGKQEKQQIQMIFKETDSSIENILNNSMSHLEKMIQGMDAPRQSLTFNDILHQNTLLKDSLSKMRKILRERLEAGLTKQREELAEVLEEYITLITKLLQSKQQLTNAVKQAECEIRDLRKQNQKLAQAVQERENQIEKDKKQLNQCLVVIQQYQQDDNKEQLRMETMMLRIQELQSKAKSKEHLLSSSFSDKREVHDAKVQTLIQLLEKAEQQNSRMNEEIKNLRRSKQQLRENYEDRIASMNRENQEEFVEYQKVVKETLDKKDECIERLNVMVESLKRK